MEARRKNKVFDLVREEVKHFDVSFTDEGKEASKEVEWLVASFREAIVSEFSFKSKEEGLIKGVTKD